MDYEQRLWGGEWLLSWCVMHQSVHAGDCTCVCKVQLDRTVDDAARDVVCMVVLLSGLACGVQLAETGVREVWRRTSVWLWEVCVWPWP